MSADLALVLPEILLAVYAMAALVGAAFTRKDGVAPLLTWLTAGVLLLVMLLVSQTGGETRTAFEGSFVVDGFARFAKVVILGAAAVVLVMGQTGMARAGIEKFEYPVLVVLAVIGMMVMVSAGDLIVLYMGLELQSLALYVVAALRRDSVKSTEAGMKYFVLGALSSGLLLYGSSLVYGFAGTTGFEGILAAAGERPGIGLLIGLVFVLAGLAFKVSAAPFHMWTPDVYEGAPTPITALFATAPKVAAMALIGRVVHDGFGGAVGDWQQVLALLAALSVFVGAIAAIGQRDIKRLMAYSSIAHMGYALIGLAAGTEQGVSAMLLYMAIYVAMNLGTFAFILSMEHDGRPITRIESLSMLSARQPAQALAMLVLLFSLAGVPPLAGFFGKYAVLWAAVDAGLGWLAVAGALASVIGAFYYLRLVYFMYFGAPDAQELDGRMPPVNWAVLAVSAGMMLFGVINLFGVDGAAARAAATLVN